MGRLFERRTGNPAIAKESALVIGVHSQSEKNLTKFKKNLFVEPAEIGFDEAFLRGACTLDPEIEGTAAS
jgi:hypothetical protein